MDKEEGQSKFAFLILIFIFIQWIGRRADCHLDSVGRRKDKNYHQSTFKLGRFAVVFTRRAVSRISGYKWEIDHLGN
jgi:hypothetical protein